MNISRHAHERLCQRLHPMPREKAAALLERLWQAGYDATPRELRTFNTIPMSADRKYRIVTYKHRRWLLVLDVPKDTLVTMWSKQ